jgi:phage protein U
MRTARRIRRVAHCGPGPPMAMAAHQIALRAAGGTRHWAKADKQGDGRHDTQWAGADQDRICVVRGSTWPTCKGEQGEVVSVPH